MISMNRRDLVARIAEGDALAIAEGIARNASRLRKGKAPIKAYASEHDTVLTTIAEDSDAMSGHDIHVRTLEGATYNDLADREAELDRELWAKCLEMSDGSRWKAYNAMDAAGIPRTRIAAASGCTNVNSVTQGISKYRRGIAPDLSFAGK
jgi:hypothetical protein